jgi:hypothetical protein
MTNPAAGFRVNLDSYPSCVSFKPRMYVSKVIQVYKFFIRHEFIIPAI